MCVPSVDGYSDLMIMKATDKACIAGLIDREECIGSGSNQVKVIELLEKYKLVELAILYSRHRHCKARDKMLKVCAENLKDIVDENVYIEILARMIKAAGKCVSYEDKCFLYEDALIKLDNGVRKVVSLSRKRRKKVAY